MDTKVCTKCKISQPTNHYHKSHTKGRHGVVAVCKECMKLEYQENKEVYKCRGLRRLYGITYQDFKDMLQEQNSRCLICSSVLCEEAQKSEQSKPHIDHCHTTGKVRGILCSHCNPGLGYFKDSPSTLKMAIAYLEHNDAK